MKTQNRKNKYRNNTFDMDKQYKTSSAHFSTLFPLHIDYIGNRK